MSPTVYLVTGAGRGLGYAFVEQLAARPDSIVFAGVRSFPPPSSSQLGQLVARLPEVVVPILLSSGNEEDNAAAAEIVRNRVGKVDVVIANAGESSASPGPTGPQADSASGSNSGLHSVRDLKPRDLRADFETNTVALLVLFQAFAPLLLIAHASHPGSAKFISISTSLGQINNAVPWSYNGYGASKAAANYLIKKIHLETPEVIAFPIHPGLVDTDMGRAAVAAFGATLEEEGGISPLESVSGVLAVIDMATKDTHSGNFWNWKGEQLDY